MVDEINPISFIDYIDQFLYYNIQTQMNSTPERPYFKGSVVAIKTMLRMLKELYGDTPEVFNNLEIIPLLIKKICQQVHDLPKSLAVNIAIQILIKELPTSCLKKNAMIILNTLFMIVNQSTGSVIKSVEKELQPTFEEFFKAIGCYDILVRVGGFDGLLNPRSQHRWQQHEILANEEQLKNDYKLFTLVVDKILKNLLSLQKVPRSISVMFLEKIASSNNVKVYQILQNIPYIDTSHVPRPAAAANAEQPAVTYWAQYLHQNEVEKKVHDIIKMFKSGYTQVQTLISYIDILLFSLKHCDEKLVMDRKHIFVLIADYLLLILEDESDLFERSCDKFKFISGPNVALSRITKQYVKMERYYLNQNKDYDPYSNTMHSHQLLNKHFFEVNIQAKEERIRAEIAEMQERHKLGNLKLYNVQTVSMPDELNEEALKELTTWERRSQVQDVVNKKVLDYIQKLFGYQKEQNRPASKLQDISFEYMRSIYEMYPNVRIHSELIVACLKLLCNIVAHPELMQLFKARQKEFFTQMPTMQDHDSRFEQSSLRTAFDYFIVEIKAKIIGIVFKFFQRDEIIIQKQSKQCLKLLLSIEHSPNEALPNIILKEVIRPYLSQISVNKSHDQNHQHLSKLIKILYSCFNDQLKMLLSTQLKNLQDMIMEDYIVLIQPQPTQPPIDTLEASTNSDPTLKQAQPAANMQQQQPNELNYLIEQYNDKVLKISTAAGIINVLPLLIYQMTIQPSMREIDDIKKEYQEILLKTLQFQHFLIYDFERKFEEKLKIILLMDPNAKLQHIQDGYNAAYKRLSPLQTNVGHLQSDIKNGIAKLFNIQQDAAQECFKDPRHTQLFFEILNQKESYCLRERLSRDRELSQQDRLFREGNNRSIDNIRQNNNTEFTAKFVQFVNQAYTFSKFYPQYLQQKRNIKILDDLRFAWLKNTSSNSVLITQSREVYMKIQKCLVIYCKNEHSDTQILFDLLKEFFSPLSLDMSPLIQLCTIEIPQKASIERKISILNTTLDKIQTSQSSHEQKYTMFEFAFMPIMLQCANNSRKFHELFSKKLISKFIETFFFHQQKPSMFGQGPEQRETFLIWRNIQTELEHGYKINYQNFFIEIVKVLSIFLRFVPSYKYFLECISDQHEMNILNFLDWVGKNATDQCLKEHAFYTLSAFGVRKMNLDLPDWPEIDNQGVRIARQTDMSCSPSMVIRRVENGVQVPVYQPHFIKKQFLDLLSQNVLAPLLEIDHTKIKNVAIVENTFCNLHKVFSDPRTFQVTAEGNQNPELIKKLQQSDNGFWEFFKRRYSLKPALSSRLKLCNLVCKKEAICNTGEEVLDRRLIKTIKLFAQQNFSQSYSQFKEPLEIIESLFQQAQVLLKKQLSRENLSNLHSELTQFSAITFHIFLVRIIGLDTKTLKLMQQSGTKNDFIQFAEHCMHILKKIMSLCSKPIVFYLDNLNNDLPKEVYAIKTIISMNLYSLSLSHEFQFSFNFRIMIDYLRESHLSLQEMKKMDQLVSQGIAIDQAQAQAKNLVARSIAQNNSLPQQNALYQFGNNYNQLVIVQFPVHLITLTLRARHLFRSEQLSEFLFVLKQAIKSDVQNQNKRDIKNVQSCLVRDYIRQQATEKVNLMQRGAQAASSNPTLINSQMVEDQKSIQLCMPNFAIRMIQKLEKLKEEGTIVSAEFDHLVDKTLYKEITQVLFKVISAFRQSISSDKQSLKPQAEKKTEVTKKEENDEDMSIDDDSDSDDLDLNKAVDLGSKARSVNGKTETYIDYVFPENQLEFKPVEYSIDIWTKESIMIALKSIVIHMKSSLHQDEAFQLLEQVKIIMKWFQMFKTCEYLLEQLFEVTKLLVIDTPDQKIKLVANEKIAWLYKLLNTAKLKEISDARQVKDSLVNKVFDLCLDFLESQISINAREGFIFLLDKLMLLKPTCSFELRKRIYRVFEKFHGSSLRAKLIYFFSKLTQDDHEKVIQQCQINNLLDFTLYNFQEDIALHKVKDSSSLYRMSNSSVVIQGLDVFKASAQGKAIQGSLKWFTKKFDKYKNKQLNDLMKPLSEIIRINPEHSLGDNIAEKIFSKVFWQFWHFIERSDQQYLAEAFNKIFQNFIKLSSSLTPQIKSQFCKTLLEQVVALKEPQVRIEPEVLQYLSKHFNLWHVCIPQLEDHVLLFPNNERYVHSLQELYDRLMEEDLSAGLSRIVTKSPEMRTLITLGQHERWDQINQQFSQYINFYSEQEGFFSFLEGQQRMPGKYSRQITKTAICEMIPKDVKSQLNQQQQEPAFVQILEEQDAKKLLNSVFPKAGSNRKISDIDLRMWETLYVKSLRILKRFDLYKDTLENMYNREMKIEFLWSTKNLPLLEEQLSSILAGNGRSKKDTISENSIQRVKYHLYQNYILGNQGHQREFDTNFRDTIKLAINQLCENLPLYMDRVHNEYHILFQLINESNEGGRNILMCNDMKRFSDFRNAMNIWRERLPHECESILVWQELLENRNFIFQKLKENILNQNQAQASIEKQSRGQEEDQIDIVWNNLKLAEISRKQELPQLSNHYLQQVKDILKDPSSKGEILKLERFKFMYETFKLVTKYQTDSTKLKEVSLAALDFFKNQDYDLWMHAEILRLEGEFALNKGYLKTAKDKLLQSIDKNKKESKTWIAYGKLNELIFNQQLDSSQESGQPIETLNRENEVEALNQQISDKSIQNALKGYFCGVTLNQSKSRLIIPYILNLLKTRSQSENKSLRKFVYINIQQMPAWIWIFWMPQLLHFLKQTRQSLQQSTAHRIFTEKLCKLYPQATYYTLREKQRQIVFQRRAQPAKQPQEQVNPQDQIWQELIDKNQRTIKSKNSKHLEGIHEMIQELFLLSKVSTDDTFLQYLFNILNYSQQILIPNSQPIEAQLNKHLSTLYERFLKKHYESELAAQTSQTSKPQFQSDTACSQIIASEFYKHFIDKNTREKDFLQQMKLIKNFKDFMLIQKQLKDQQPQLQEMSPNLVNFNTRGIELPGQYVLNTDEPRPENIKLIEKIKPVINRNGQNQNEKKIEFKCNDGKSYAFAILLFINVKPENQFEKFLSDERATQLKVIINMMFGKHKESKRRGLKLYAAPKILLQGVRLVKDNLQFADFQSTHDYLLMERGLDPDMALLMHIEQVKDILEDQPVEKRQLSQIELEHVEQINFASYKHMVKEVEPFLLASYFHRIFYNVDNMFIFKKQFTKFHAVNSFFAYAFNQSKFLSLNQLSFCKASGKINFTDTELRQAQCPRGLTSNLEFEDIEADLFQMKQKQVIGQNQIDINNLNYLPFRLTPNFEAFIGQIGVQGLMAGVMTSASLAISSQQVNFATLLKLLFADEFQKESLSNDEVVNCTTEFCMFKILSLVNHERILDQPEKDQELRAQPLDPMRRDEIPGISYKYENNSGDEGHFMIGQMKVPLEYFDLQMDRPNIPEEFNKKIFTLIEMATDDARRAQRHLSWCPWF